MALVKGISQNDTIGTDMWYSLQYEGLNPLVIIFCKVKRELV